MNFSTPGFSTMNFWTIGWKVHGGKVWGWKVGVEMSFNLLERWHFNPGLFNPRLFNHEFFNHEFFNPMVQKFMVEKSGVERSGVEAWGLKRPGLRCLLTPIIDSNIGGMYTQQSWNWLSKNWTGSVMANCFFKLALRDSNMQIFLEGDFKILRFEKFWYYNQFSWNVYCVPSTQSNL
jgi:hypothetical protein